jgi:hypothetical protein
MNAPTGNITSLGFPNLEPLWPPPPLSPKSIAEWVEETTAARRDSVALSAEALLGPPQNTALGEAVPSEDPVDRPPTAAPYSGPPSGQYHAMPTEALPALEQHVAEVEWLAHQPAE